LLQELHDSGVWEDAKEGLPTIVEHLVADFGFGGPERLANSLMEFLSTDLTSEQKVALEKHYADLEKLRTQSIYVDFDNSLAIESIPSRIPEKTVERWIENARMGIGMLAFLRAEKPDLRGLIASMPLEFREETKKKSEEMIANLRASNHS